MIYNLSNELDQKKSCTVLKKYIQDGARIEIKLIRQKRTIKQNAYLHVIFDLYAVHFGYTSAEAKTLLKRMCPFMTYEKKERKFLKETSTLTDLDCGIFIDWILKHSAEEGCYIPSSEEYLLNCSAIDHEIKMHKRYM